MDMGIVEKRIIIDVGPVGPQGGTPNFKCRDDRRIFLSSKVLIPGFFRIRKFGEYVLGIFRVIRFNAFWKFLRLTNPPGDFLGGLWFVGIFLRF